MNNSKIFGGFVSFVRELHGSNDLIWLYGPCFVDKENTF